MKNLSCSFILPTKNVEKYIGPLLKAIYSQEYEGNIEVLIMDSSDDKTPEIAMQFPVKLVRVKTEDYNYGKTRNDGVAMTGGEYLVFLSTDIEIKDRKWLTTLTSHFSNSNVAGVYGRQIPREDAQPMEKFFMNYAYPSRSAKLKLKEGKLIVRRPVFFSNVNSAIRRSIWENIKFPEMLVSEDLEWAKRVLLAGHEIMYDSEAEVTHSHTRSLKQSFQLYFDYGAAMPVTHTNPIIDYSFRNFIAEGLKLVIAEYRFMLQKKYWYWIPYAIIYDITKFLGIFLGTKQKYMPIQMKKALCKKKNHWDKYKDVIKEAI